MLIEPSSPSRGVAREEGKFDVKHGFPATSLSVTQLVARGNRSVFGPPLGTLLQRFRGIVAAVAAAPASSLVDRLGPRRRKVVHHVQRSGVVRCRDEERNQPRAVPYLK